MIKKELIDHGSSATLSSLHIPDRIQDIFVAHYNGLLHSALVCYILAAILTSFGLVLLITASYITDDFLRLVFPIALSAVSPGPGFEK